MDFLRKHARDAATGFKNIAEDVWDELGDSKGLKGMERTAGKYALTAQMLMALNFPDEAEMFRDTFNVTGEGPTGARGFAKGKLGKALAGVAELSMENNVAAMGTQGYADVTQTSTYEDLGKMLPLLSELLED